MKLLTAEEIKEKISREEREYTIRIQKLKDEEKASVKRLNDALEKESSEKERILRESNIKVEIDKNKLIEELKQKRNDLNRELKIVANEKKANDSIRKSLEEEKIGLLEPIELLKKSVDKTKEDNLIKSSELKSQEDNIDNKKRELVEFENLLKNKKLFLDKREDAIIREEKHIAELMSNLIEDRESFIKEQKNN